MKIIEFDDNITQIDAGFEEESNVVKLVYDLSSFIDEVGKGGELSIRFLKPNRDTPFKFNPDIVDDKMEWTISSDDTEMQGYGMFQMTYSLDYAKKKSKIFQIRIYDSIRRY